MNMAKKKLQAPLATSCACFFLCGLGHNELMK